MIPGTVPPNHGAAGVSLLRKPAADSGLWDSLSGELVPSAREVFKRIREVQAGSHRLGDRP